MHRIEEASNDGKVNMRIIHGLNISHKELIYLLQKSASHQKPSTTRMLLGGQIGRKDHRSSPTATHKEDNQRNTPCFKFVTQRLPYVHATGLINYNTSTIYIHNYPTSMTLTLPPLYLKITIEYQVDHSIQFTFYDSFYYTQLGCSSFQDQLLRSQQIPCCSKILSK